MPVYNEEDVVGEVVSNFCDKVLNKFKKKEFILIDDCSTDATVSLLKQLKRKYPYIKILMNRSNRGHGPSLLRAYREAKGDYIFYCDSDNQFMAEDFWPIWRELRKNSPELVMGYRKERNDPSYRIVISNALRLFNLILFGVSYRDVNAPFKLYTKASLERILSAMPKSAFVPTILMILCAHEYGMRISEIEVRHRSRLTGKSFNRNWRIIISCWKAGKEIIKFKNKLQ